MICSSSYKTFSKLTGILTHALFSKRAYFRVIFNARNWWLIFKIGLLHPACYQNVQGFRAFYFKNTPIQIHDCGGYSTMTVTIAPLINGIFGSILECISTFPDFFLAHFKF
jgi:hypothetical protein